MQLPKFLNLISLIQPMNWFLLGACLQFFSTLVLPTYAAFLPTATLLATRAIAAFLRNTSPQQPPTPSNVYQGRYTAQIPSKEGSISQKGSQAEVVLFVIGASSNQYATPTQSL